MLTITVANTKGGVGKTTTAIYLAAASVMQNPESRTVVIDLDPQRSAVSWSRIAEMNGDPLPFDVIRGTAETLTNLPDADTVIIDTATANAKILHAAADLSDITILPTQPETMSVQRTALTLKELEADDLPAAILITQANRRERLFKDTLAIVKDKELTVFDNIIPMSAKYKTFGTRPTKLYAYADVWQEIKEATSGGAEE